jgi:DNA helicase II / ATP-dependent DNA helicase PcrA
MSSSADTRFAPDAAALLAGLDDHQREAAMSVSGPLLIVAPAGSGKTRTIVHRIAYGIQVGAFEAEHTMAISFTNRAAGELRHRLQALGAHKVTARTFHAAALRQLRFFWPSTEDRPLPTLRTDRAVVLSEIASLPVFDLDSSSIKQVVTLIESAKAQAFGPEGIQEFILGQRLLPDVTIGPHIVGEIYSSYEDANVAANTMDFDDVIARLVGIFDAQPATAAAVQRQYRHLTVDEFQDTTVMQRALLTAWTGPARDVCAVGDPHQSIYGFAGASADAMQWFGRTYSGCETVRLDTCYRSTPQIIRFGARIRAALDDRTTVRSVRDAGAEVSVLPAFADEITEIRRIAAAISDLVRDGAEPSHIAVLSRISAQGALMEEALANLGLPGITAAPAGYFSRPLVRKAITLLRGASHDPRASEVPLADSVADVLSTMGWEPVLPALTGSKRQDWLYLQALVRCAEDFEHLHQAATLAEFVIELDRRADLASPPTVHAVSLLTAHASKGLEWPHVFIIGMSEGLFPYGPKLTEAAMAEERRLFYVAATRARDSLTVSGFGRFSSLVAGAS